MVKSVNAIICKSRDLAKSRSFFKDIGIFLVDEKHDEGDHHLACNIGQIHFALYPLPNGRNRRDDIASKVMIGFEVKDLSNLTIDLKSKGYEIYTDIQKVPWGRRIIVLEPGGNIIELNESNSDSS